MVHETLRAAGKPAADGVVAARSRDRYRRMVLYALYILCGILVVGIILNACALLALLFAVSADGLSSVGLQYLLVSGLSIVLDLASLSAFLVFVLVAGRRAELFSRPQVARLLALGLLNVASAVNALLMPTYAPPSTADAWISPPSGAPELDLNSLMLSMMFFALAGVFEYARILQEDSDSIL